MMSHEKSIGEKNYEQFADRYAAMVDTKPHNADYNFPAVISLLPDVRGLDVLDAGCGSGPFTEWLLDRGATVTGFDVTLRMVELAIQRTGGRANLFRHDLNYPLSFAASQSFDLIISPLVLDYIEHWESAFKEFFRVLKPGGSFVFSVGHPVSDIMWLKVRLAREVNYFNVEEHSVEWSGFGEPKPQITFYRRPLGEMINPLLTAGFHLDTVLEPQPTKSFREKDPVRYERLMATPNFICFRAVKPE